MAEKIRVYGRVNGKVQFRYGPKNFDADWGGAFTALEIANLMTKLPKVNVGKRTPVKIRRVGAAAEKVNLLMWLERLDLSLFGLDLDSMMINATNVRRLWVDKIFPSQIITFPGKKKGPILLVADALVKMGLKKWGIVKQLTVALSEFDDKATSGKRSVSVFITL